MPRVIDPAIKAIPMRSCTISPTLPKTIPAKTDPSITKTPARNKIIEKKIFRNVRTKNMI